MGVSVITTFTLTGTAERLAEIAEARADRTCPLDQMTWIDPTTLQMQLHNGVGGSMLHHADGLADEYPDVRIEGQEWIDCFSYPDLALWEHGKQVWSCDMTPDYESARRMEAAFGMEVLCLWPAGDGIRQAIQTLCPHYDLTPFRDALTPVVGDWISLRDENGMLYLRLPSEDSDSENGRAVLIPSQTGRITLYEGIARQGYCASIRPVSCAQAIRTCPDLQTLIRKEWSGGRPMRRAARRRQELEQAYILKARAGLRAVIGTGCDADDHLIPF